MAWPEPRRVLVTGATSGIGEAFARELPGDTRLVLTGRDETLLGDLAGELATERRSVETVPADLASPEGLAAIIEAAAAAPLHGLINNAGLGPHGLFREAPGNELLAAVDVNCRATLALTHGLLPHLLASAALARGRVFLLNVASTVAFAPVPRMAVYAASKAFVLSLTEALATELRNEPIDVLALCPGPTRTPALPFRFVPGVRSAAEVARIGLGELGRCHVAYTDLATRATLGPVSRARATLSRALGAGLALSLRERAARD